MLYISICLTLLIILLALFMLAKIKAEMLSSFYRWVTWLVLIAAGILLVFQVARGVRRMMKSGKCESRECSANPGCYHHMKGPGMNKRGHMKGHGASCQMAEQCSNGMSKEECAAMCKSMGIDNCCTGGMVDCPMHDDELVRKESTTDTIDGKIIKKEIEIIEKK